MRQLGSALVAVVIMLACASLSEHWMPAVALEEGAHAHGAFETARLSDDDAPAPRVPEPMVMIVVGGVLLGLGGALSPRDTIGR